MFRYLTVRPEEIEIIVFNRGILNGLKAIIPLEGNNYPISIDGAKEK